MGGWLLRRLRTSQVCLIDSLKWEWGRGERGGLIESGVMIGYEGSGMGRIITLKEPRGFQELVDRVKGFLGLKYGWFTPAFLSTVVCLRELTMWVVMIGKAPGNKQIRTIAICAGSGGSMLRNVDVDLLFTGELSHHEALAAKERGVGFITCESFTLS